MSDLERLLDAFQVATQCEAAIWVQADPSAPPRLEAGTSNASRPTEFPSHGQLPAKSRGLDGKPILVVPLPGPRHYWLVMGPCNHEGMTLESLVNFLSPVVAQHLQSALEVEHAANELAERYEEINLLYTISEILGRTVSLVEAARTILAEVSETVGARRASILVHDEATNTLRPVAVLGADPAAAPVIPVDDECSVSGRVFRTQRLILAEGNEMLCETETIYRRGAMLSVPIMWTSPPPRGAHPLGVVNLSDRRSGQPFSAGDQKLIAAIATQIGSAIQNARLVRASLEQQRLVREMELAHDLQMKLLPAGNSFAPEAQVAARVVPAESVGGDFYNLFRLANGNLGAMIGDVSGHGYQAALIMALTMSAAAIQAQRTTDPGEMLHALLSSVHDELETTEMFISVFYAVIDREHQRLCYANTGHPHAFVLSASGELERLAALDPPLGMGDHAPSTRERHWDPGRDLLVLFTDGVSDARNRTDDRLGEERVIETLQRHRREEPAMIMDALFETIDRHTDGAPRRDDLTLVLLET